MSSLMTDGDNAKQLWQDEQNALVELMQDGWNVEVGPSTLYAEALISQAERCVDACSDGKFIRFDR